MTVSTLNLPTLEQATILFRETAAPKGAWFTSMSKEAQAKYLKNHPSKFKTVTRMEQHDKYAAWHGKKAEQHAGVYRSELKKSGGDIRPGPNQNKHAVAARTHRNLMEAHTKMKNFHTQEAHKHRGAIALKLAEDHGDYGSGHEDTKHGGSQAFYDRHYKAQNAHDDASEAFASAGSNGYPKESRKLWNTAMNKRKKAFEATANTSLRSKLPGWRAEGK